MFNVSTSAYDLTTKQDIWISTEPAPSWFQPFLQCSLPPNNNTAEGALRWRIHLVAASGCWCISVSVCVCVYFPQGLHRGWMLCCCYKWSCGRLTDSQARCGSTCLITTHTHTHTSHRCSCPRWVRHVGPRVNSHYISCQLRESVNQLVQVS